MEKPTINFIQSSQFFRENDGRTNSKVENLYIDDNGFLRNFWGYRKIFTHKQKINSMLQDISGEYFFFITDNNSFVITNTKFFVLYEQDLSELVKTNDIRLNQIEITNTSICQATTGDLVLSNGGDLGLFIVVLPREANLTININAIKISQYAYAPNQDYDPNSREILRLGKITYIDAIDDKIVLTDSMLNRAWFSSNIFLDANTTWEALSINSRPDKLQRAIRIGRAICLVGVNCVEFWYVNNDDFGFARYNFIAEYGTFFPKSIVKIDGLLVFLGSNNNSSPEVTVINFSSKDEQIKILNKNGLSIFFENIKTDNVFALNFSPANQDFYIIHVDETTLLIDINNNNVFFLTDANRESAIMDNIIRDKDRWLIQANDGSIYIMSSNIPTYDEKSIPMKIITPTLHSVTPFELQSIVISMRPVYSESKDYGKISFYANFSDAQSQGIQTNFEKKLLHIVPLLKDRTIYHDEHVGSNNFFVCQLTAIINPVDPRVIVFNQFFAEIN